MKLKTLIVCHIDHLWTNNNWSYTIWNIIKIRNSEAYFKSCQISKMEFFAKIVYGLMLLTIFAENSILAV